MSRATNGVKLSDAVLFATARSSAKKVAAALKLSRATRSVFCFFVEHPSRIFLLSRVSAKRGKRSYLETLTS